MDLPKAAYVIGIDGGGTKTAGAAVDPEGRPLVSLTGPSTNPFSQTPESAALHLIRLVDEIMLRPELADRRCLGVCCGIAGAEEPQERAYFAEKLVSHLQARHIRADVQIVCDVDLILAAAGKTSGIAVVSGTGSIVLGVTPTGERYKVGGWGPILGDQGSGYRIGLRVLQAVMLSYDGIAPPTRLTDLAVADMGLRHVPELLRVVHRPDADKSFIARFAALGIRAAESGDAAAIRILEAEAIDLAAAAKTLIAKDEAFRTVELVVAGSIFRHSNHFLQKFQQEVRSEYGSIAICGVAERPEIGAARLAMRL